MFTLTFRRRRRIRALILGLAVTVVALLGVSVMGVSAASAYVPPPQADALAASAPVPPPQADALAGAQVPIVPLVAEKFVQSRPAPGLADVRTEPTTPPVRRFPGDLVDTRGGSGWNDGAIGAAIIGCLLLAGGLAIAVTGRRPRTPDTPVTA